MLGQDHFYFGMIKKYIVAFSYIISDIEVVRINSKGNTVKQFYIPYTYSAKSKLFYRNQRDNTIKEKVNKVLPLISFVLNRMEYDPERAENSIDECILSTIDGVQNSMQQGVPYDFNVDVKVKTKYLDDMFQIVEQIGTAFNNYNVFTINEISSLGIQRNIPITLNFIELPDDYNFSDDNNRKLESNLNFTIKGYLYPPVSIGQAIKEVNLTLQSGKDINVDGRWEEIVTGQTDIRLVNYDV